MFLYPAATLFCILITGNHYWLDAFFGGVALGIGWLVAMAFDRWVWSSPPAPDAEDDVRPLELSGR